jgi:hypothetical protein
LEIVLSIEAGRRVVGGIFHECGLWNAIFCGEGIAAASYREGMRAAAVCLVSRIREIDPMLIAQCEVDYRKAEREMQAQQGEA